MNDINYGQAQNYTQVQSYNLIQAIRGPIMLIALGSLVAMDYFGVYGFGRTWPILIILFGVLKLLEKITARPVIQNSGPTGGSAI
jgi:fatty acid desaturase